MRPMRTGLRESLVGKGVKEDFLEEVLFEPGLGEGMGAAGRQDKGKEETSEGLRKPPGEPGRGSLPSYGGSYRFSSHGGV